MVLLIYLLLGAVAGLISGLFGVGGGLIIVPTLIFAFSLQGLSPEYLTHSAVATSLACIIINALSSIRTHQQHGAILWPVVWRFSPGLLLGAALGVVFAKQISGVYLQFIIAGFIFWVAIQMGFALQPKGEKSLPGSAGLMLVGTFVGILSALFGIGGGSMTVPFLSWCRVQMQKAVATSAACGLPIAVVGALANIVSGWGETRLAEWYLGFVYLPAFFGIVLISPFFAHQGAKLAHALDALMLKRLFALLLFAIAVSMSWQAYQYL